MNIKEIKRLSKELKVNVDDLIALSKSNDPYYIQKNSREKAEWFRDVWVNEGFDIKYNQWVTIGKPQDEESKQKYLIHPRGLHYKILEKGYQISIKGEIKEYLNTDQCWNFMETGAKYARLLGLVPYDGLRDLQNPDPLRQPNFYQHSEFEVKDVYILDDFYEFRLPYLKFDNIDDLIENKIKEIIEGLLGSVKYYPSTTQPNYLEIWAEKSGVIPMDVAREFNTEVRPAKTGEFSLDMCHYAVNKAKELGKDLHVFILSDFDPKGKDMPKSASRKVEFVAHQLGVNAFVHHVALTKEQCIEYALPTTPAKTGKSKGYDTHAKIFKEYAGQDPTELNSFMDREPIAYREVIRKAIEPYYDRELVDKFKKEKERLEESIREKLKDKFEELKEALTKNREEINEKLEDFNSEIKPIIEEKMNELNLDSLIKVYSNDLNFDVSKVIEDEEFNMPEPEVEMPKDALLDTRRGYLDQIKKYKEFDIRE